MVDEPWDGLKGEVGPVLASIAPSAAMTDEARPDVWLWLPGVLSFSFSCSPGEAREAVLKGGVVQGLRLGLGSAGNVSEEERMGQDCLREGGFLVLEQHGSRPSKRQTSHPAWTYVSLIRVLGKPGSGSVS